MKLLSTRASILSLAILAFIAAPMQAVTIAENISVPVNFVTSNGLGASYGQTFTLTGTGTFTNVTFNFFQGSAAAPIPYALGTAFLLSAPYTGTAAGLSSGTAGYLGQAVAAGGFYSFGAGVTLTAGPLYFLYTNGLFPDATLRGGAGNPYAGGDMLLSLANGDYAPANPGFDAGFRVTGDAVGAPDGGSTALLLALGVAGLWFGRRARLA